MQQEVRAHVILIGNGLYGYGESLDAAWLDFEHNIAGTYPPQRRNMRGRAWAHPVSAAYASEVAECIAAPAISWDGGV